MSRGALSVSKDGDPHAGPILLGYAANGLLGAVSMFCREFQKPLNQRHRISPAMAMEAAGDVLFGNFDLCEMILDCQWPSNPRVTGKLLKNWSDRAGLFLAHAEKLYGSLSYEKQAVRIADVQAKRLTLQSLLLNRAIQETEEAIREIDEIS
jgi:hypothetical protein